MPALDTVPPEYEHLNLTLDNSHRRYIQVGNEEDTYRIRIDLEPHEGDFKGAVHCLYEQMARELNKTPERIYVHKWDYRALFRVLAEMPADAINGVRILIDGSE